MLSDALYSYLSTNSAVTALVGTTASRPDSTTGIFPGEAPDEPAMPYVVFSQVDTEPLSVTLQGTGSLLSERWRISSYGTTYRNAKKLAKTILRLMVDMQGRFDVNPSLPAAFVSGAYLRFDGDTQEALAHGTLYGSHNDFEIVYNDPDT